MLPSYKISKASKMPCPSFSLPASRCITGRKLASEAGSVCSGCYANKGNYRFPNVKAPREANYAWLMECQENGTLSTWAHGMAGVIANSVTIAVPYFRWHDSGDLQSVEHLEALCLVAELLPSVTFWLPTREYGMVTDFLFDGGTIPANLTVRLSAHMVGKTITPPKGLVSSSVGAGTGLLCPATYGDTRQCGACRACWDSAQNVDYRLH